MNREEFERFLLLGAFRAAFEARTVHLRASLEGFRLETETSLPGESAVRIFPSGAIELVEPGRPARSAGNVSALLANP